MEEEHHQLGQSRRHGRMYVRPVAAAPDQISEKVEESIKNAKDACSDDPVSGECAAAWDETLLAMPGTRTRNLIPWGESLQG
ncbi:hypothetical protein CDL12_11747 [Handroanthus impetiginosus]|uniref:Uncharacterized protein n=1 Tax=Handroanthus impetiginosus TaxID=429701 RepID=A0A2G9HDR3_9LAMI|nr:hypothetical protein CDL12_11747 [Handroanthus impetiginosus]